MCLILHWVFWTFYKWCLNALPFPCYAHHCGPLNFSFYIALQCTFWSLLLPKNSNWKPILSKLIDQNNTHESCTRIFSHFLTIFQLNVPNLGTSVIWTSTCEPHFTWERRCVFIIKKTYSLMYMFLIQQVFIVFLLCPRHFSGFKEDNGEF